MNLRRLSFFALDAMRGGAVRKHLDDLRDHFQRGWDADIEQAKLSRLLRYSSANVPFYKPYASGHLSDYPVIDKNAIRQQSENFLSKKIKRTELVRSVTSGSTGTPFVTFQDKNKRSRNAADTIFFAELAGYRLGEALYYCKIWNELNKKTRWTQWQQNIRPIDVFSLNEATVVDWIKLFQKNRLPKHVLAYASVLDEIAKHMVGKDIVLRDRGICSVISMSEALSDDTKRVLNERFGVIACSRYSNLENGIIAQQTPESGGAFLVNSASYCVEILDVDRDVPVEPGKLGRIVVTDLYNFAMPLVRYDTGDMGSVCVVSRGTARRMVFSAIEGRKLDVLFDTKGELVSSYIVYKNMWRYPEINQYQLIQEGEKSYRFKINTAGGFGRERELRVEFLEYLGFDADFKIEYVSEIPLLDSGKRRKVINDWLKRGTKGDV